MSGEPRSAVWLRVAQNQVVDEKDELGSLAIYVPRRDRCLTRVTGRLSSGMARRWVEAIGPLFRDDFRFVTFHKWDVMTSYESSARRTLTSWLLANTRHVASADFLVSSRLVAMGVSAANVLTTLGGLSMLAHTERSTFEAALDRAM